MAVVNRNRPLPTAYFADSCNWFCKLITVLESHHSWRTCHCPGIGWGSRFGRSAHIGRSPSGGWGTRTSC